MIRATAAGRIPLMLLVGLGVVVACGGAGTEPRTLPPLVPFKLGATFSYHSTDTIIGEPIPGDRLAADSDFTVHVVVDTADGSGVRWAKFDAAALALGPPGSLDAYYTNASDGLRRSIANPNRSGPTPSILMFLYPAQRGQFTPFGPLVSATDTVITVPAGTFHCLRYDLVDQPTPGPVTYWSVFFSPGTGVIQRIINVSYFSGGQLQVLGRHDRIYRLTAVSGL
jgi:hypothetical protein